MEEPEVRLSKDLVRAAATLSKREARYLVDLYYQMQDNRIRAAGQVRSMEDEPRAVLAWYRGQTETLEKQVKRALDHYSKASPLGLWARRQKGVGPVIAAGLLAHLDFEVNGERTQTVSRWWSFAGLDPTKKWERGKKRPWNATLKTLCAYKLGEAFVKVCGHEDAFYGQLYRQRKEFEVERNEAGKNADAAARALEEKKYAKGTDAYKAYSAGKLPPAHVHHRAVRWTVKLFLSHYHEVGYKLQFGEAPPKPYVFSILGHADIIHPPE